MTARSRGKRSLEHRDGWNEDDHPRDDDGKFTDKGGGSSGKSEKSKPELKEKKNKQLSEKNIKNLKVASEKEFSDVVDKFTARDYKDIPNVTRLPDFDKGLADKLGLSNGNAYLTKEGTKHINPERRGIQGDSKGCERGEICRV